MGGEAEGANVVTAVDSVNLDLSEGQAVGLVGQSGSGKTTIGRLIVRLEKPTSGNVFFQGVDVHRISGRDLRNFRAKVQMIFQDPYESLDPRISIQGSLDEPLVVHGIRDREIRSSRIDDALTKVGLTPPRRYRQLRPHQLSGGQRQRAAIARALILEPKLVIADEPVSMLDVSVSTEILNLMVELRQRMNISYIFITHNLAHAAYFCDRICVLNQGRVVEEGDSERVLQNPENEYTKLLIASIPLYLRRLREMTFDEN